MATSMTTCGIGTGPRVKSASQLFGAALLTLTMTACGDGGAGGGPAGAPGSGGTVSSANLIVAVTDPIGMPAIGARVIVQPVGGSTRYGTTGPNGQAEIRVTPGRLSVYASAPEFAGSGPDVTLDSGATLKVSIATHPRVEVPAGGIANAFAEAVSADGRILQISLGIFPVNGANGVDTFVNRADKARIEDCVPDATNDAPGVQADCIKGPARFDASYAGGEPSQEISVEWTAGSGGSTSSFETLLLLDQSAGLATDDPADRRLFAAKYLLSQTHAAAAGQKRAMLGAFAADDAASGRYSALPQKPLTLFPLENPRLTSDGRSFFPIIDTLATLEGGAGVLLSAVDKALDFIGANAWTGGRGLVVVGSGADDACGSRSDCIEFRDAVIAKGRALGVRIVMIGIGGSGTAARHESMNLLAQSNWGGASLWLDDPSQFAAAVADAYSYLADVKPYVRATFRIESPTAGAFASGRTVLGKVRFEDCPWDCYGVTIPFAVQIP
jgi:hypothetical protein